MEQLQSAYLRLSQNDLVKGAIMAVITAVFVSVAAIVSQPNFDVFGTDWTALLHNDINVAVVSFFAYLTKNLFTDSSGKLFGRY